MANEIISGEDKAWEILAGLSPQDVCRRSGALFDEGKGAYRLDSFGKTVLIDPLKKTMAADDPSARILLTRLVYFYRLSALWYLVKSVETAPSGKLVKPGSLPGGDMFFKGSHVLPLGMLANRYAEDREGFCSKARELAGKQAAYGDAAFEIPVFPRIPVTLILWLRDDEWDARADVLFDSTVTAHLPIDIIWSIAMMSILITA
ncbi:MAG: hypothetical protein OHK006_05080 [Thermodesulfovibrionales bacterium]